MKYKLWSPLLLLALTLSPAALASTTWYVDGVHGSDSNNCKTPQHACKTIGHTISLAHSGDSIMVAAGTYTENLTISVSLKIIGSDTSMTIVHGRRRRFNPVIQINNIGSTRVTLSNLTIKNGFQGGVTNNGTLTINNSTISGNGGTGVNNGGTLTVNNSTISGNRGVGYGAGGISNFGTLTVNNSTISGNSAALCHGILEGAGGGILSHGTLTVNNSTLSRNQACLGGGIFNYLGFKVALQNSIVANSPSGGDCNGTMTSKGYNLSSDDSCNFNNTGDLNNTDPLLGALGNYGGPTQTIPLLSGSPAIDAGNPSGCTDGRGHLLKTDQRGKPRPDKEDTGGCDMGAFERQSD
jgi:hypothetical protein